MSKYFVGVDVSKGYSDFALLGEEQNSLEDVFRLDDTLRGHTAFIEFIADLRKRDSSAKIYIGVESTGGLEDNWFACFQKHAKSLSLYNVRLNPAGVAQYVKADRTRTITDAVSAKKIAEYLIVHHRKIRFNETSGALQDLRPLWSTLTLLKKQRGQLTNDLHHMLYGALPSILLYCRRGFPQWVISVIQRYPTAKRLANAKVDSLARIPFVTKERATKLIEHAKHDVASHVDEVTEHVIKTLTDQIHFVDQSINSLEKRVRTVGRTNEQVQRLCSFKGIGEQSAVGLLLNMPDLNAIADAAHLASYWGLHPVFKQSGDGKLVARMSKTGRVQPRAILFMVTLSAITCNPLIKERYRKLVYKEKMTRMSAIGVCMHKIARIIYGMLRTNTNFDPAIDKMNKTKLKKITDKEILKKEELRKRRFEKADELAPISKREAKKRVGIAGSQSTKSTENEITSTPVLT